MENQIQIFNNPLFGDMRAVADNDGEAWFVGVDVARKLGYSNASKAVMVHVDEEDRRSIMVTAEARNGNLLRASKTTLINESGVYNLIFRSKLESAQKFKHWVTSEVLPQIRKTGGYLPLSPNDDDKTILEKARIVMERTLGELR